MPLAVSRVDLACSCLMRSTEEKGGADTLSWPLAFFLSEELAAACHHHIASNDSSSGNPSRRECSVCLFFLCTFRGQQQGIVGISHSETLERHRVVCACSSGQPLLSGRVPSSSLLAPPSTSHHLYPHYRHSARRSLDVSSFAFFFILIVHFGDFPGRRVAADAVLSVAFRPLDAAFRQARACCFCSHIQGT